MDPKQALPFSVTFTRGFLCIYSSDYALNTEKEKKTFKGIVIYLHVLSNPLMKL